MLALKTILFATDFSQLADEALDHALALAHKHEAELHMLHAVVLHADDPNDPAHHFPDAEEVRQRLGEIADDRMANQLETRNAGELDVVRAQRRGMSTAPVILEYAEEIDADIIVMSTHGRRGLGHVLLGSVTEEVVRLSSCPVLTIRGRGEETGGPRIRQVLVPVDFSEHSERAAKYATEICAAYGARLHLLHVFEQPITPEVYLGGGPASAPDFAVVEASLREALHGVGTRSGAAVDTEFHVLEGGAVGGITDTADAIGADLIVIATHGLGGLAHVLIGSVTERVVRRSACPVLTVKAFGKSLLT
jgi:nucleotide-binding universal stress UspA family protein